MSLKSDKEKLDELWEWRVQMIAVVGIMRLAIVLLTLISGAFAVAALFRVTP